MTLDTQIEIRAAISDLRNRLAARGKIKSAEAATSAELMKQLFMFIEQNMKSDNPDQVRQRAWLNAARKEWENIVMLLDIAPALDAMHFRSKGGKKAGESKKAAASKREAELLEEAAKLELAEPGIKKEAVAGILADRGHGGKEAIAKKLRKLSKKSSEA